LLKSVKVLFVISDVKRLKPNVVIHSEYEVQIQDKNINDEDIFFTARVIAKSSEAAAITTIIEYYSNINQNPIPQIIIYYSDLIANTNAYSTMIKTHMRITIPWFDELISKYEVLI